MTSFWHAFFSDFFSFVTSPFYLFLVGLCWGSFLNVLAHRLITGTSPLNGRSSCPLCAKPLAWYDLIPLFSWFALRGRCRHCAARISWLYPAIELLTAFTLFGMAMTLEPRYWIASWIYVSALIVTVRTDITDLIIMRQTTIFMLPWALGAAYFNLLPITILQSLIGMIVGTSFLALVNASFWLITHKRGIGQGDIELSALIGAFTGFLGWWTALIIASTGGTIIGIILFVLKKASNASTVQQVLTTKIPLGALLAIGSIIYTVFQKSISALL